MHFSIPVKELFVLSIIIFFYFGCRKKEEQNIDLITIKYYNDGKISTNAIKDDLIPPIGKKVQCPVFFENTPPLSCIRLSFQSIYVNLGNRYLLFVDNAHAFQISDNLIEVHYWNEEAVRSHSWVKWSKNFVKFKIKDPENATYRGEITFNNGLFEEFFCDGRNRKHDCDSESWKVISHHSATDLRFVVPISHEWEIPRKVRASNEEIQ